MSDAQALLKKIFSELMKHAQKDDCYACKQLLKDIGEFYHIDVQKVVSG